MREKKKPSKKIQVKKVSINWNREKKCKMMNGKKKQKKQLTIIVKNKNKEIKNISKKSKIKI